MPRVVVDGASIEYTATGTGPPVVFVHGAYVTGAVWDEVTRRLSADHYCIAPTWPFGAQLTPVGAGADLGVVASGRRIAGLLEALDLSDVTLVANDTGGGIVLAALGDSSLGWERVSRLVFTNCDSFEHFPPRSFAPIVRLCRLNATAGAGVMRLLTTAAGRRVFLNAVTLRGLDHTRQAAVFGGFLSSGEVRREAVRFTSDLQPRYTLAAVGALRSCPLPVLLAWGADDRMFPIAHGQRLADTFPHAVLRIIEQSRTYVMVDQPDRTADEISGFSRS